MTELNDLTLDSITPEINPCLREISADVPAEDVNREWKASVALVQKHAKVPGFREGKVPESLIRTKFAQEIRNEVLDKLLPPAFRAEAAKQKLVPLTQPQIVELELEEDKPLHFKVAFEVVPEFDVTGYKDVKVSKEEVSITDEEVEKMIANLRERTATYANVDEDRELADGDYASASFKSLSEEEGAEPIAMDEVLVEIGGDVTLPEFTANLRGVKAGETRKFQVKYEDDHGDARLAGKTMNYEVNVKGIKSKILAELNDEWVKELGQPEVQTVEQLTTQIREGMLAEKKAGADRKAKEELLKQLTEKFPIPVPQIMVNDAIDQRLEHGLRQMISQGLRPEHLQRMDMSKLREGQKPGAMRDVQVNLLLERIAGLEGITVSDEEMNQEIMKAAMQSQMNPLELRKKMEENHTVEGFRSQLRCDRALDWLVRGGE